MNVMLNKGSKYLARVKLTWLQKMAGNETVGDKFRELGFADVLVIGEGGLRRVSGVWTGETQEVNVPDSIVEVIKIG